FFLPARSFCHQIPAPFAQFEVRAMGPSGVRTMSAITTKNREKPTPAQVPPAMKPHPKFGVLPQPPSAFDFEPRYVQIAGYQIHYVETGSGKPTLFVHGNPTSAYTFRNVLRPVAQATKRRSIALDLLGFGKSAKPRSVDYTVALHRD